MQLSWASIVACLFFGTALAQSLDDVLRSKLTSVYYPPIAEQARIQGDVRLHVNNGVITVLSGHPLLAPIAAQSAKAFGSVQSQTALDMTYHFVLVETVTHGPTVTRVRRGNAFQRAILRVLGLSTETVVHDYRCEEGPAPTNHLKLSGAAIEVWIFGKERCLQTQTATLVAPLSKHLLPSAATPEAPTGSPQ
jgi:hypothetical protein